MNCWVRWLSNEPISGATTTPCQTCITGVDSSMISLDCC